MQTELQRRLDAERPRNHLDMRHRLSADGSRYGKLIPYAVSEQRMDDLLSELCDAVDTAVQLMEVRHRNWREGSRVRGSVKVSHTVCLAALAIRRQRNDQQALSHGWWRANWHSDGA